MLDLLESKSFSARILDFHVGKDRMTPTEMRVQVFAPSAPYVSRHRASSHRVLVHMLHTRTLTRTTYLYRAYRTWCVQLRE